MSCIILALYFVFFLFCLIPALPFFRGIFERYRSPSVTAVSLPAAFQPTLLQSCTASLFHQLSLSRLTDTCHAPSRTPETTSAGQYTLQLGSDLQRQFGGEKEQSSHQSCCVSSFECGDSPPTSL